MLAAERQRGEAEPAPPSQAAEQTASGSSFYLAMRILPRVQREAMYVVYGFCRAVDDIADGDLPRNAKAKALQAWRDTVDRLAAGGPDAAELPGLAATTRDFGLRREDFLAVVDGMQMDADGPIRAPSEGVLDLYCERVASAVGRLSNRIFGLDAALGDPLAHHLGRALQLTNILRDLDEDAALGRLYLPREALLAHLIDSDATGIGQILADPGLDGACRIVAARAEAHFEQADRIMRQAPRRQVRAPRLMATAYQDILARLLTNGWRAPRKRQSMSKLKLAAAALRYGII